MATITTEKLYHRVQPICETCEKEVRLECLGTTAEGYMELLGACLGGHLVRVEMHFAEMVAKAAAHERTGRGHNIIHPVAHVIQATA